MSDNSLLLQQLMDIKQPDTDFGWPLAPGWWLLIVLLLFTIAAFCFYWYKTRQLRREALVELLRLEHDFISDHNMTRLTMNISMLLRRVAMAKFSHEDVAGLTGQKWLEFLDIQGETKNFTQGVGLILLDVPYQNTRKQEQNKQFEEQHLIQLARSWIRNNT